MSERTFKKSGVAVAFALLFLLVFIIYSNTYHASWQFDDYANINYNYDLHMENLSLHSIYQSFFAYPGLSKKLYRPIPCMTIAINWYWGKDNVVGYHAVNISIHFITAFFLFLTVLNLFHSKNLRNKYQGSEHFIALLAAALWAVNPIQTQAVTYIVQRMAAMAAMFYIIGIYFYIKARLHNSTIPQVLFFTGCLFCFMFALGSKENSAIMPIALILVEVIFFQSPGFLRTKGRIFWASVVLGGSVFILVSLFLLDFMPLSFLKAYEHRSFSFAERLLTEPRVLIFHISQIFYPVPNRLSIDHDIGISTSLFEPWTTLPSILAVIFLVSFGFFQIRKRPVVSFAILFFFLNHLIESSIIGLEIIFEHRNYLPSMFFFFPVALYLRRLIDNYHEKNYTMYLIIASFISLLLIGLGSASYIRNMVWNTEETLWEDALKKSPGNARPYLKLAMYFQNQGDYNTALKLYNKALLLKDSSLSQARKTSLNNMAHIYYEMRKYDRTIKICMQILEIDPKHEAARYNLTLAFIKNREWQDALETVDVLLQNEYYYEICLNLKGFILIMMDKPLEAIPYLRTSIKINPNDRDTMVNLGIALSKLGRHEQSQLILRYAENKFPKDFLTLVAVIESSINAGKMDRVDRYSFKLFAKFNVKEIRAFLRELSKGNIDAPIDFEILNNVVVNKLRAESKVFLKQVCIGQYEE